MIKHCISHKPFCDARVKRKGKPSLCCRYGWCCFAKPVEGEKLKVEPV